MKALSIKQPWAWQIIYGGKDIENRNWKLPEGFTLPQTIAVHASKNMTRDDYADWWYFSKCITNNLASENNLVFGAIIGTVEIVGLTIDPKTSQWFCGYYGFILANPRPLVEPISCKGALGFWEVPNDIKTRIEGNL
jgi:hypothetical protein